MTIIDFKFELRERVLALDYAFPPEQHEGTVLRRWVDERYFDYNTNKKLDYPVLEHKYTVLIDNPRQECEFLEEDLTSMENDMT